MAGGFLCFVPADAAPSWFIAEWQERLGRTKPLLLSDLRPNEKLMLRAGTLIYERAEAKSRRWTTHYSRASPSRSHAASVVSRVGHAHPARKARAAASRRTEASVLRGML